MKLAYCLSFIEITVRFNTRSFSSRVSHSWMLATLNYQVGVLLFCSAVTLCFLKLLHSWTHGWLFLFCLEQLIMKGALFVVFEKYPTMCPCQMVGGRGGGGHSARLKYSTVDKVGSEKLLARNKSPPHFLKYLSPIKQDFNAFKSVPFKGLEWSRVRESSTWQFF